MSAEQSENTDVQVNDNAPERTADRIAASKAPQPRETLEKSNIEKPAEKAQKPAGYDPVDISDLPEDKQKVLNERFGYYHKQVKELERRMKESDKALKEWQEQQVKQILDLTSATTQIVDHMETRTLGEQEADIKKAMKEAFESGDVQRYIDEQARLTEIITKRQNALKKEQKQAEKAPKNPTQEMAQAGEYWEAAQIAKEAIDNGELAPEKAQYVEQWQSEKDENGNLLRPWAFNPTGGVPAPGSPMDIAMKELASIVISPAFSRLPFENQLAELDRRMGVQSRQPNQTVLGGSLTRPTKTNNIRVSQDEERLAIRMKFGGPKAKSDADHVKAWRENKEKYLAKQQRSR